RLRLARAGAVRGRRRRRTPHRGRPHRRRTPRPGRRGPFAQRPPAEPRRMTPGGRAGPGTPEATRYPSTGPGRRPADPPPTWRGGPAGGGAYRDGLGAEVPRLRRLGMRLDADPRDVPAPLGRHRDRRTPAAPLLRGDGLSPSVPPAKNSPRGAGKAPVHPTRARRLTGLGFKRAATAEEGAGQAPRPGAASHGAGVQAGGDGEGRTGASTPAGCGV